MQYQSNMPLINPFDPQAPLPALGTNPNPLSLAGVPIPSFQEMLNGPDAKQNAQQLSEYMRKRFAAQTAVYENLPQRFDTAINAVHVSAEYSATGAGSERSAYSVGRTVSNQILRRALPAVAQSVGISAVTSQMPLSQVPAPAPGLILTPGQYNTQPPYS
ncbi:unnamed protein product [Cylicocyclus nassatus]|uniref:Uncharacterized protein n=1 Tax=Cylicocyclus nassatus TaxID=53992 RepID=A0AA36H7J3_CYLNA|nr:unnamed protein product [Cylicocyclus nassatus]